MKRMRTVAAMSLVAVAAAGCSQGDDAGGDGGDVVIRYISSTILESPEADFEQGVVDEFNALDNGIRVEVEGVAANDLMEKYTALATAGQMPDFYMADMKNTTQLVDMGLAADVRDLFDADYLDAFDADALAGYTIDDVPSAVPWFTSAQGIVYRTDLFEAAGVEAPTTWDELVQAGQALTGDGTYGIALVGTKDGSGAGRFQYVIRNFGVEEFTQTSAGDWQTDIGSDAYVEALTAFTDLATVDGIVPPGVTETDYSTAVNLLASGQAAMLITGSNAVGAITSRVPELAGKLGSFPIPAVERSVFSQNGFGFFVSPTGEHQDAVAEFLQFMVSEEKAVEFSTLTGRLPTITAALSSPEIGEDPALAGFMAAFTGADTTLLLPTIDGYGQINDIHGEAYQSVLTGSATPQQAAERAGARAQDIVDEANG